MELCLLGCILITLIGFAVVFSNHSYIFTIFGFFLLLDFSYNKADGHKTGECEWKWVRSWKLWDHFKRKYFDFNETLDDDEYLHNDSKIKKMNKIYAGYPHGVYPASGTLYAIHGKCCLLKDKLIVEGKSLLLASNEILFKIPIVNRIAVGLGCISADKEVICSMLDKGRDILIHPEGVQSILINDRDKLELYVDPDYEKKMKLKIEMDKIQPASFITSRLYTQLDKIFNYERHHPLEHRGFLDIAWEKQIPVVPIFHEGENRVYKTWKILPTLRFLTTKLWGYPLPTFFIGPIPTKLTSHIGPPVIPYTSIETKDKFINRFFKELFILIIKYNKLPIGDNLHKRMVQVLGRNYKIKPC